MELWDWHKAVLHGRHRRRAQERLDRHVRLRRQSPVARYHFDDAWPPRSRSAPSRPARARCSMEEVTIVCECARAGGAVSLGDAQRARPLTRPRAADGVPVRAAARLRRRERAVHREGVMRLATARDEIMPQRDPRVRENAAYLTVLLLTRTVTPARHAARGRLRTSSRACSRPTSRSCRTSTGASTRRAHRGRRHLPDVRPRVHRRHRG